MLVSTCYHSLEGEKDPELCVPCSGPVNAGPAHCTGREPDLAPQHFWLLGAPVSPPFLNL